VNQRHDKDHAVAILLTSALDIDNVSSL